MSSNIPTRRVTRAARSVKENENANARTTRTTTRSKAPLAAGSTVGGTSRTIGSADASAQGKRKREILNELSSKTSSNKPKVVDEKGKGKDMKEGNAGKAGKATASTRVPLRTVTATQSARNAVHVETKKAIRADAMIVDQPSMGVPVVLVPPPPGPNHRTTTRQSKSSSTSISVSRQRTVQATTLHAEDEYLEEPVTKKRRTSSEIGDEAHLETVEEECENLNPSETPQIVEEIIAKNDEDVGWDDLDVEDVDDPAMVSEYAAEIFEYFRQCEQTTLPNPNYITMQKDLSWGMRGELVDWLIQLHGRFRLQPETLFICINLVDRFLSMRMASINKLQLIGVTCMFIAGKFEETTAPAVSNFIYAVESTYTEADILNAEKYILKTVEWNLSYPSPFNFLRRISKADDYDPMTRTLGKYFVEIGCLEWRLLAAPPSLLSAASMWLARIIVDHTEWTPNLRHYAAYTEEAVLPTANILLNFLLKPTRFEAFYKKYASKKYYKVSVHAKLWVRQNWEEGTHVDLLADLPQLKEMCRERRRVAVEAALKEEEEAEI